MFDNRVNKENTPQNTTTVPEIQNTTTVPEISELTRNTLMKSIRNDSSTITPDGTLTTKEKGYLVDNVINNKDFIKYLKNELGTSNVFNNNEITMLKLGQDYITVTPDGNIQLLLKADTGRFFDGSSNTSYIKTAEKELKNLITDYEKYQNQNQNQNQNQTHKNFFL